MVARFPPTSSIYPKLPDTSCHILRRVLEERLLEKYNSPSFLELFLTRRRRQGTAYIAWKVSYTVISPPPKIGQPLAFSTASPSESALIIEYPVASVPTEPSLTVPLLAMCLACGVNGLPPSTRALPSWPNQAPHACMTAACAASVSGMLPPL